MTPVVGLVLLPLIVVALTLAFLGLALWELALLVWRFTIRMIRTRRPGPQAMGEGPGEPPSQASDPTLCVPAPRQPAEDSSRLRALAPARPGVALPWANLLRAKMAVLVLVPG